MANTITFTASNNALMAVFDGKIPAVPTGRTFTNIVIDTGVTIPDHASGLFHEVLEADGKRLVGTRLTTSGGDIHVQYFCPENAIGIYITTAST